MGIRRAWKRLLSNFNDADMRANVLALAGGKVIGLALLLTAMSVLSAAGAARAGAGAPVAGDQRHQHGVGAARRLPRVLHAGRLRHARSRVRPIARVDQHPRRRHRRHLHLRRHVLGVGLRLHVRAGQRLHRHDRLLPEGPARHLRHAPASRCWRSGSSSSRSPTPARRSPRARWSAAAASSATSSTASASPGSSTRSSATGRWGPDGWLAVMAVPFRDFAGSTVVHTIGGAISLIGAIALGPRLGRVFRRDGGGPPLPHNIILGAVGGLILWFGWYGFNPGQHAVGAGHAGHRARLVQHHDGGVLGRPGGAVLRLHAGREVGPRPHRQRLPGRPGRDHRARATG